MTEAAIVAIGRALVWLACLLVVRNIVQIWVRYKEDQAALDRAQARGLFNDLPTRHHGNGLGNLQQQVAQHVPRGTSPIQYEGTMHPLGGDAGNPLRSRLSAQSRPGDIVLPDDLEAHVMQWEDSWARDDERAIVRSKFVELYTGDPLETWQLVRRAVGIGELP